MKRLLGIFIILSACSGTIERDPRALNLLQLDGEPMGCRFIQTIDVDAEVFNRNDAIIYLENRIADLNRPINAYWITRMETSSNSWNLFGKDRTFLITANTYNCPGGVVTRGDAGRRAGYVGRR